MPTTEARTSGPASWMPPWPTYARGVTQRAGDPAPTTYPAVTREDVPPAPGRLDPQHRLVITLLLVSAFVVILNETVMGVALSRIMTDLGIEATRGQWLTTAFMLTMAIVIPVTGYLLRRLSTRAVFLTAMSTFTVGTLMCALSDSFELLVAGRVVQATGTAMMMPLLMTTVMQLVPALQRGRVMGNISIVISVAPAMGPAVSGVVVEAFGWRGIFWTVLPLVVIALVVGAAKVPNVTEPRRIRLDVLSVALSAVAFGGLIFGLSSIGESVHHPPLVPPVVPIAAGAVSLGLFVWRQLAIQQQDRALLDLRTFTHRSFASSVAVMVVLMGALFGTIIVLPLYLQDALGLDPLATGLLLVPGGLTMGLLGPVVGRLYDRWGPRPLVVPGTAVVALALGLMTQVSETTSPGSVLAIHVILSIGLGLTFTPLFTSALGSLPRSLYAHGSATIGTVQQLAGAAGTAMFVVLLATGQDALQQSGAGEAAALAGGVRTAFVAGAVLAVVAIAGALLVRRPAMDAADAPVAH